MKEVWELDLSVVEVVVGWVVFSISTRLGDSLGQTGCLSRHREITKCKY